MNITPKFLLKITIGSILFVLPASLIIATGLLHTIDVPNDFNPTKSATHLFYITLKDKSDYILNSDAIGLYKLPSIDALFADTTTLSNVKDCMIEKSYKRNLANEDNIFKGRFDETCYQLKKLADSGDDELSDDLKETLYAEFKVELDSAYIRKNTADLLSSLKEKNRAKPTNSSVGIYDSVLGTTNNVRYLNWSNHDLGMSSPSEMETAIFVAVKHMPCTSFKDEFYPSDESSTTPTKCERVFGTVFSYLTSEFIYEQLGVRTYEEYVNKHPRVERLTFENAKPHVGN